MGFFCDESPPNPAPKPFGSIGGHCAFKPSRLVESGPIAQRAEVDVECSVEALWALTPKKEHYAARFPFSSLSLCNTI